jgi:anti-sigma factor RsiW
MKKEDQTVRDEDLHAYIDNQLTPERRTTVGQFLREDPVAAERVSAFSAQRDGLRAALAAFAEAPVPRRLDLNALSSWCEEPRRSTWRMAAAIVLALGLGGSGGWFLHGTMSPRPNNLAELLREAVANHMVYTADHGQPAEFEVTPDTNPSRQAERLKWPMTPPDLSAAGFRFMGGRRAATPDGPPASMFVFRDDRVTWLTVFLRSFPGASAVPITAVQSGRLQGCAWIENGVGYMVVAALPQSEVRRLADDVRRQLDLTAKGSATF